MGNVGLPGSAFYLEKSVICYWTLAIMGVGPSGRGGSVPSTDLAVVGVSLWFKLFFQVEVLLVHSVKLM